jgi:hypothetical protein
MIRSKVTLYRGLRGVLGWFCLAIRKEMRAINKDLFLNNQPDALIIQIYPVIKIYMFRTSSLPIIRSSLLYIRHW